MFVAFILAFHIKQPAGLVFHYSKFLASGAGKRAGQPVCCSFIIFLFSVFSLRVIELIFSLQLFVLVSVVKVL